jgi:hypothetical protein
MLPVAAQKHQPSNLIVKPHIKQHGPIRHKLKLIVVTWFFASSVGTQNNTLKVNSKLCTAQFYMFVLE